MKVNNVFPHPIGEVMIDYDNDKLISDIESVKSDIETRHDWDCEVISSFHNAELNNELISRHLDLLHQVTILGNKFLTDVGWVSNDEYVPNDFWVNVYQNEHWQDMHHHGAHALSAIYYVTPDLTPTEFLNPNEYTFHQRYFKHTPQTDVTQTYYRVLPQPGKIVFFPGYMFHRVPAQPQSYDQRRITIAFNFGKEAERLQKVLDMGRKV